MLRVRLGVHQSFVRRGVRAADPRASSVFLQDPNPAGQQCERQMVHAEENAPIFSPPMHASVAALRIRSAAHESLGCQG
jgi:hypothetical protein